MKWCRFQSGQKVSYGVIDGTTVTEVTGSPFESHTKTSTSLPLSSVKLLVPVIPPTFYAAGINYRQHVIEMAHRRGVQPEFPSNADVGYRANNALCAQDEPIVIPKDAGELVRRSEQITPMGRMAEPQEIVGAVLFLATRASAMVTGHVLAIDGGFLAQ